MSYTIIERSSRIYNTVAEIFNYTKSSDVVTPIELVRRQVADLDVSSRVCVPGAGIGTYVLALIEKGVKPENITAVELDSKYYELGSSMFERFGVNYVHENFLTWKPEMQFDVIVGNPPYSDTTNVKGAAEGGCSKGLDNRFFEKCMELSPYVSLIIRSKFFAKKSSIFRRKLFSAGGLQSIEALPAWVFPSISLTETCIVTYSQEHAGTSKITFQSGESREIEVGLETCLKLTNADYNPDTPNNLAHRHLMGNVGLNEIKKGNCPMILTLNSKDADIKVVNVAKEQHECGVNQHGVVMNRVYGGRGLGRVFVKPFDHSISRSAVMLKTDSEEESQTLCEYLRSQEIQDLVTINKISNVHSKELFKTIVDPLL